MTTPTAPGRQHAAPAPAAGKPQQWFTLRPWLFDVTAAAVLLRAAPRPPQPLPVAAWARAYGLAPDPGSGPHAVSLIGPGPDFSPEYAMSTDLDEPVIIASIAARRRAGRAAADRRLPPPVQGRRTGREQLPRPRAHRRRDPGHPPRRDPRPAPPGRAPAAAPGHRTAPPRRRRSPMLTGITTRTSTPHEDAEPGPGEAPGRSWATSPAPSA